MDGNNSLIIIGLVLLVAIVLVVVAIMRRRQRDDPGTTVVDGTAYDQMRHGRPDLRVDYGDPSRQMTVVDDDVGCDVGVTSPLMVGKAQIIGNREDQEDDCDVSRWDAETISQKGFMAVLADGIGGLEGGQYASQAAVTGAMEMFKTQTVDEDPAARVLEITAAAQHSVLKDIEEHGTDNGCTFLCVLIDDLEMCLASVGDSRIELYRNGVLLQLNREHVLSRDIDDANALTGDCRVETEKRRKAITAYLGKRELRTIDRTLRPMQLVSGDRVLLMSDGVFNTLSDNAIIAHLHQEPQLAADSIVRAVESRQIPSQDNASIVIIGVK